MRTLFTALFVFFYLLLSVPRYLVCRYWIKDKRSRALAVQNFARRFSSILLSITGTKVTVTGQELLPNDQPVLFVSNHQSYFDIPLILSTVNQPVGFIAKKEMSVIPVFAHWIRLAQSVFIDRKDLRQSFKAIMQSAENLKNGQSMVIFPEGTRAKGRPMIDFKKGSIKPATIADTLIVPVAINGAHNIFEANPGFCVKPCHVSITYGEPINYKELPKETQRNSNEYIQQKIVDMLGK